LGIPGEQGDLALAQFLHGIALLVRHPEPEPDLPSGALRPIVLEYENCRRFPLRWERGSSHDPPVSGADIEQLARCHVRVVSEEEGDDLGRDRAVHD
jgi:hypothetical protein